MGIRQSIYGSILNPRADGSVDFIRDGALISDERGLNIAFVGDISDAPPAILSSGRTRRTENLILPPFLDAHIHIPQHPIRGHFMDGVAVNAPQGRLIAGLNRNVFPAEAKCADREVTERVVRDFALDTLSQGVVGGAAYMTVHPQATDLALDRTSRWQVGLVLMEMNCPDNLKVDVTKIERQMRSLIEAYGERYIVTDRFAVAVGSDLRRRAVALAREFDLRMQTHLNEQLTEKHFVERVLYPDAASYTDVYRRDGLLERRAILAHCIHMSDAELDMVAESGSVVAHCPTSNTLLCSGIMPLDRIVERGIDYAICTDVGASPTTSLLAEMAQFLKVHEGRSARATPSEALFRTTYAPSRILGHARSFGSFAPGMQMSYIEVRAGNGPFTSADDAIRRGLLEMPGGNLSRAHRDALDELAAGKLDCGADLDLLEADARETARRLENKVIAVTMQGQNYLGGEEKTV